MNKVCPKCQTENIATAKFCRKCGSPLVVVPSKELSDIDKRVAEEKLYEKVAADIKNGIRREGLYAKALVDANGSSELAHALYIKYAVQSIKDELTIIAATTEAAERVFLAKQLDEKMQQEKEQIKIEEQLTQQQDLIKKPYEPEVERWDIVIIFALVFIVVIVVVISK